MIAFYAALRAIKLYPLEHTAVQKTLVELSQVAEELRAEEGELEFRVSGEFIFLNATRLRLDLSNYATFGHILTLCKLAGIGAIHVGTNGTARDWTLLLSLLGGESKAAPSERYKEILSRLKDAKIETFQLDAPTETASDRELIPGAQIYDVWKRDPARVQRYAASDVAEALKALMDNRFITGTVLHVDGGHRLV